MTTFAEAEQLEELELLMAMPVGANWLLFPAWQAQGACADEPPELFFVERGGDVRPAKAICASCPTREPCLRYALDQGPDLHGIWAGTSRNERRHLLQGTTARRIAKKPRVLGGPR